MSYQVKITETAGKGLKALAQTCGNPQGMLRVLQRRLANEAKAALRDKDRLEPNKLGGERTHFWKRVAEQIFTPPVTKTMARVAFGHEAIRQKALGGTITAKRTKNLAIPISPISYGHSPREIEFQGRLRFQHLRGGKKGGLLIDKETGKALWLLKPEVQQKPWPGSVPDLKKAEPQLLADAKRFCDMELQKAIQSGTQPPTQ